MKALVLVSNGFDAASKVSLSKTLNALGIKADLIADTSGVVNGWEGNDFGLSYPVKKSVTTTMASDYDLLILPEGIRSVNKLKTNLHVKRIMKFFFLSKSLIVTINDSLELLSLHDDFDAATLQDNGPLKANDHIVHVPSASHFSELEDFIKNWTPSKDRQIAA